MAQPPVSRSIQQLERELGTRLFDRSTRSVKLTGAGEAFIGPATDIIDATRRASIAVHAADKGEVGRVRVAYAGAWHPVVAARTRERLAALNYDMAGLTRLMAARGWTTVDLVWRETRTTFHARNP